MNKRLIILFLLFFCNLSIASVVMVGTRVIYPQEKKFVNLNFRSTDNVPSILELWVSKSLNSKDKSTDAPFVITPSIFKIDPNKGQSAKLVFTGSNLPNDRESIFYLNFLQLPATDKNVNKIIITYKSTVKVFYRPSGLTQRIDDIEKYLSVRTDKSIDGDIIFLNDSEYYITPTQLNFNRNGKTILSIPQSKMKMIAPLSQLSIKIKPGSNLAGTQLSVNLINDFGGISTYKMMEK